MGLLGRGARGLARAAGIQNAELELGGPRGGHRNAELALGGPREGGAAPIRILHLSKLGRHPAILPFV